MFFFSNDTATTEIYTLFPTRRSSDLCSVVRKHYQGSTPEEPNIVEVIRDGGVDMVINTPYGNSGPRVDRKSTRLNSSHVRISYAVFCLKKKKNLTHTYLLNV